MTAGILCSLILQPKRAKGWQRSDNQNSSRRTRKVAPPQPRYSPTESGLNSNDVFLCCWILKHAHDVPDYSLGLLFFIFWEGWTWVSLMSDCKLKTKEQLGQTISVCQGYNELQGVFVWIHTPDPPSAASLFFCRRQHKSEYKPTVT